MQIIFRMYRQYQQHITAIELYINFEEIVAEVGPARQHDDTISSSYLVSS